MMTWPYFCYETPPKTTVTHQRRKVSPLRMNLAHGVPIVTPHSPTIVTTHSPTIVTTHSPTTYTSHKNTKSPSLASGTNDLTINLWWNIIKNNSNQLPQKVSPLHPDLAHEVPIADDEHCDHNLWWPDHKFVAKHHQKQQLPIAVKKCHHCTQIWDMGSIKQTMNIVIIIYDDLTILLWWNIIKNNSNKLPQKLSPLHPNSPHGVL